MTRAAAPASRMRRHAIYVVVQEGGSSTEAYATSYNTKAQGLAAVRAHAKASYRTMGPFEVTAYTRKGTQTFIEEADVLELVERVRAADYADFPEEA